MDTTPLSEILVKREMKMAGFARAIGVHKATVHRWVHGKQVPPQQAIRIEALVGIPREQLRPDLWPSKSEAA